MSSLRQSLRAQLWPLPALGVFAALAAGVVLPRFDAHIDGGLPRWFDDLLFGGDPGAARALLDAVSSSLITVTSLTFSLTVVTLQLASSQFSPRLLRTFTRDLFVQATLALFLATFVYALTVLRSVRSAGDTGAAFVPHLSVTLAFVLAVLSVLALVLFLAHLARQIRVETMLRTVHADASDTVRNTLGPAASDKRSAQEATGAPTVPAAGVVTVLVTAPGSGFLIRVEEQELLRAVVEAQAILVLDCAPGDFIVKGTPIGRWWHRHGDPPTDAGRQTLTEAVGNCVNTGSERTEAQDVGYGLRTLTDVANKALSPGINDPTTAVHALGHTSALLRELAQHNLGPVAFSDDAGLVRLVLTRPDLAGLLDMALTQPRRYGAGDPLVLARLFTLLAELAWHAPASARPVIAAQLHRLRATTDTQNFDSTELTQLAQLAEQVEHSLSAGGDSASRTHH